MPIDTKPIHDYIKSLEKELSAGDTTEHSHRPALKTLLETLNRGIHATNEPQHITAVGAPDFRITKNMLKIGNLEAKDIGVSLDESLKTEQLKRYLKALPNLVLTDYLEFRWFVAGQLRLKATLGTLIKGRIKQDKDGVQEVADLLTAFLGHEPEPIGSPRELAGHLARLAHLIRGIIIEALKKELVTGSLHAQWLAFRENLIPDLPIEQFADMYAQTIAYGLFAARCETEHGKDFIRQQAGYLIPKTNPFLRNLFSYIAGPQLDEHIVWAVDDLAQILAQADMEAVLKNFGKSTGKDDPVVHFYETFLKEYDSKMRELRGVYYTPLPVVSYIVRSIDHILKTRFEKPQGLADPGVLILDPAVGTATFLYMVMQEIHNAVIKHGQTGTWNDYVAEKLLPRLFGFELLMAPYAIAHLKLGRLLKETGYQFQTDQRLGIYLTNTLEEAVKQAENMFAQWITEEANAAADIKKTKPIMVVLGNPPYSGASANASARLISDPKTGKLKREFTWIGNLIEDYKVADGVPLGEKNPKMLHDDYVKFVRFGQWRVNQTGQGILGFITNHSYLDNPTFRGMRQSLMNTFTDIYILNLHGNSKKREVSLDGSKDENVFDIQQGVSIGIFIKEDSKKSPAKVHYADLWGKREGKYGVLSETDLNTSQWEKLKPTSPHYLFVPQDTTLLPEYEKVWKITDIFPTNSVGIVTSRDDFVFDNDMSVLKQRMSDFRNLDFADSDIKEKFHLNDTKGWKVTEARNALAQDKNWEKTLTQCLYRPFDTKILYYHKAVIERSRPEVMRHILAGKNYGIISTRQVTNLIFNHMICTDKITEYKLASHDRNSYLFPLYLYPTNGEMQFEEGRRPNLNPEFIKEVEKRLGMRFQPHPVPSPSTERELERGVDVPPSPFTERGLEGEVSTQTERGQGGEVNGEVGDVKWRTPPYLWEKLKPLARQMRKEPTVAESTLWQRLRNHQLSGSKFRRQHSIERFIVDFYCSAAGLVIEIDGPIHQYQKEEDVIRQTYIESQGLRLLRFQNDEVINNLDTVIQKISNALNSPSSLIEKGMDLPLAQTLSPSTERGLDVASPSPFTERGLGGEVIKGGEVFTPEDIFYYAYAVFHSPTYRKRYAEFLKIDFPRLPLTSDKALFKSLAEKGAALVALHLMESPLLNTLITIYPISDSNVVEKVSYDEKTQRVYINKTQYFEGVPLEVWNFHIGGYQVCEKWLKDRKSRKLSIDDINHYQKIVVALKETIRLMTEIDGLITKWPIE